MNYGIHWLMNVVTGRAGFPAGVLIRALEPLHGVDVMRSRRGRDELTNGPARVTQALAVGPELQSHRLDRPPLWFSSGDPVSDRDLEITTRIGISQAVDRPFRYYDRSSEWISKR